MAEREHDPIRYLDQARGIMDHLEREPDLDAETILHGCAQASALAAMAQAAALLQPSPEEVIAVYQETTAEVLGEEAQKAATARQILQEAARDGSRRHPAIHAALEVLGDG